MQMRVLVLVTVVAVAWTPVHTHPLEAGLALGLPSVGGLLLLKALLLIAAKSVGKRSVDGPVEEGRKLLLSTATKLDRSGCILKLLCRLQTMPKGTLTAEEDLLVNLFLSDEGGSTARDYKSAFLYAADIGSKTHDSAICEKVFSKCPLSDAEMTGLLQLAWGCGFDIQQLQ